MCGLAPKQPVPLRTSGYDAPAIVHQVLGTAGSPLDRKAQSQLEARFGHDFSKVRVHTDGQAADSAEAVHATAYTVGSNIVFGAGRYSPDTLAGKVLLAHELTHVVQQQGVTRTGRIPLGAPEGRAEREAAAAAAAVVSGQPAPPVAAERQGAIVARDETAAPPGGFPSRRPRPLGNFDPLNGRQLHLTLGPLRFARLPLDPAFLIWITRETVRTGAAIAEQATSLIPPAGLDPAPKFRRVLPPDPDPRLQAQVQAQVAAGVGTDNTFVPISFNLQLSCPALYIHPDGRSRQPLDFLTHPSLWKATNLIGEPSLAIGAGPAVNGQPHLLLSAAFNLVRFHFGEPKGSPYPDWDLALGISGGVDINTGPNKSTGYPIQGQLQLVQTQGPISVGAMVVGGVDPVSHSWTGSIALVFGAQTALVQ